MATKFSLNVGRFYENIARKVVRQVVDEAFLEIQQKSPVDTGKYLAGHKKMPIVTEDGKVIGRIVNEGDYPERVERGFRKGPVNWHMRDGTIYHNKGAETYERALAKTKAKFTRLLQG